MNTYLAESCGIYHCFMNTHVLIGDYIIRVEDFFGEMGSLSLYVDWLVVVMGSVCFRLNLQNIRMATEGNTVCNKSI